MSTSKEAIDLFSEINALHFPQGEYIVVGSGIMAAKGIRPAYDLDVVVTQKLFDLCLQQGWELKPWTRVGKVGKGWLKKGIVDLHLEINCKDEDFTAEDLLRSAEVINDIPFISLEQLSVFKKEYGRPKDFEDIELISQYLSSQK